MKYFNWKETGIKTFSGFSGWQMASNILSIIPYIDMNSIEPEDEEVQFVHQHVKNSMDSINFKVDKPSAAFMWRTNSPLQIMYNKAKDDFEFDSYKAWNYVSVPYKKYSIYMMSSFPIEYLEHYIVPNSKLLFNPYVGLLKGYRPTWTGRESLKDWFNIKHEPVDGQVRESRKITLLKRFVMANWNRAVFLCFFVLLLYAIVSRGRISDDRKKQKIIYGILLWLLIYSAFSIFASPIFMRYFCPIYNIQLVLIYMVTNEVHKKYSLTRLPGKHNNTID